MDIKQIQELVKLVTKSGLSELSVKENGLEITVKAGGTFVPAQHIQGYTPNHGQQQQMAPSAENSNQESAAKPAVADANTFIFKSPMIGTFYRKPSPDKEVFVKVGDTIKKGDVLCIIEAMKLFNEIEFDGENGKIVKILSDDVSPVEYDQPLFLIEKS